MNPWAFDWAFHLELGKKPKEKFVLICMAAFSTEDGLIGISENRLCELTELTEKDVRLATSKLLESALILDTGMRCEDDARIKVFRVNAPKIGLP